MSLHALATCSYTAFQRPMGTAVRITRSAPRWVKLPDPRYTDASKWLNVPALMPGNDYFKKVSPPEFRARYLGQLDTTADQVVEQLAAIPVENGRLVLLCFEKDVTDPLTCHRRMFAQWWEAKFGGEVPELGDGK